MCDFICYQVSYVVRDIWSLSLLLSYILKKKIKKNEQQDDITGRQTCYKKYKNVKFQKYFRLACVLVG